MLFMFILFYFLYFYVYAFSDDYEIIGEAHWQILENAQQGTDEVVLRVYGYRENFMRKFVFHLCGVLLCCIPYFVVSYYPKYGMLKYSKCSLNSAKIVFSMLFENIIICTH